MQVCGCPQPLHAFIGLFDLQLMLSKRRIFEGVALLHKKLSNHQILRITSNLEMLSEAAPEFPASALQLALLFMLIAIGAAATELVIAVQADAKEHHALLGSNLSGLAMSW